MIKAYIDIAKEDNFDIWLNKNIKKIREEFDKTEGIAKDTFLNDYIKKMYYKESEDHRNR